MSNIELSIEELEGQRAVLLPPREELGKKKNKQKGLINVGFVKIGDVDIL